MFTADLFIEHSPRAVMIYRKITKGWKEHRMRAREKEELDLRA